MEFLLGHEEEGWYSGQLKGQTGVFPFNYVEELSSPVTVSSAPTTDGKQLSSGTISKIHPDKPLIPIPKWGGTGTFHHDDPTPPTSAGETECLPQCMRLFILYFHLLTSAGCLLGEGRGGLTQLKAVQGSPHNAVHLCSTFDCNVCRGRGGLTQLFLHIRQM